MTNSFAPYDVIFADINPVFLVRLTARVQGIKCRIIVDDIENPILRGPFEAIVAVLVRPQATDPEELAAEFRGHGFGLHRTAARPVAGGKTMLALEFPNTARNGCATALT